MFFQLHRPPVLIDEVQYAPELFVEMKKMIDAGAEPGSFWLTGSQQFRLMELSGESLAGRIAVLPLSSLSQHELHGTGSDVPFSVQVEALRHREDRFAPADTKEMFARMYHCLLYTSHEVVVVDSPTTARGRGGVQMCCPRAEVFLLRAEENLGTRSCMCANKVRQ